MSIKRPAHRPVFEPSPADRATVQNLAALGKPHRIIAECVGKHGVSEPTLRKHFKRELLVSGTEVDAMAMASLVKALRNGESWATTLVLKCKNGWQETERRQIEHSGPGGSAIDVNVTSPRELLAARIAGIAERNAAGGGDSKPE